MTLEIWQTSIGFLILSYLLYFIKLLGLAMLASILLRACKGENMKYKDLGTYYLYTHIVDHFTN